jgi:formate dehydrogenase subunit delta
VSTGAVIDIALLVEMANQIGDFFAPYPPDQRTEGVRNHLRHYWDPRMREALLAHIAEGGAGLHPHVLEGARGLHDEARDRQPAYPGPPKTASQTT